MKVYECLVKHGHAGAGKYFEALVRVHANDILHAMNKAARLGGTKKGHQLQSARSVLRVRLVH